MHDIITGSGHLLAVICHVIHPFSKSRVCVFSQCLYVSGAAVHAGARRPISPQHRRFAARPVQSALPFPAAHAARPGRARLPRILLSERGEQHWEPGFHPHSAGHQRCRCTGRKRQLPPPLTRYAITRRAVRRTP